MHRNELGSSGFTVLGGVVMTLGASIYLFDLWFAQRNWHLFRTPSAIILAVGGVLAAIGAIRSRTREQLKVDVASPSEI